MFQIWFFNKAYCCHSFAANLGLGFVHLRQLLVFDTKNHHHHLSLVASDHFYMIGSKVLQRLGCRMGSTVEDFASYQRFLHCWNIVCLDYFAAFAGQSLSELGLLHHYLSPSLRSWCVDPHLCNHQQVLFSLRAYRAQQYCRIDTSIVLHLTWLHLDPWACSLLISPHQAKW